jgi:DNA-binding response OmpR family regulator
MATVARILIVEDEFLIAATLQDIATDLGYQCVGPASTLAAALRMAESETFQAALVHLVLAGQPADALCELLEKKGIPFAFATGLDGAGDGRWKSRPTIRKPYSPEDVRVLLMGMLRDGGG